MASVIDNKNKTMLDSIKNSLHSAERVDIITAFFYFSGFDQLAQSLKDKHIRIIIGKTIDPKLIADLCNATKRSVDEDLDAYALRGYSALNNLQKKLQYTQSFVDLFNKSVLSSQFDSTASQKVFAMFVDKLNDGSLELRLASKCDHKKVFILTNKPQNSFFGDQKGVVFMGSSNLTYNGLKGQGEINERFADNTKYDEYSNIFENMWNDSKAVDISVAGGNRDFAKQLKDKLWLYSMPKPYVIFVRILYELYSALDSVDTRNPHEISGGKFDNYKYQIDAIKVGIDCINKNNGVIIADVVGLGKSIIAAAIARNLDINKTVIVAPPHLCEQWDEYNQEFGLRGTKVISSGKLDSCYDTYANDPNPILYIIDEAHRYRNELSANYGYLHQLTRSHPDNKVILLTATPYNNRPQDLFALVKLFQTPSRSTISSVDNLGLRFRELIATYNRLEKDGKKSMTPQIEQSLKNLSGQLRILIDPVIVRRSRIDLKEIREYQEDLEAQNIKFPQIVGPNLLEYDLGHIREKYISTLEKLSSEFLAARYNSTAYLKDDTSKAFNDKYGVYFEDADITHFQSNLAQFIKRLLVMRFESSKASFKATLDNILLSYNNMKTWWSKGYVPILKRGTLPEFDPDELDELLQDMDSVDDQNFDINKIKKKAIPIPAKWFKPELIEKIDHDIELLTNIKNSWFDGEQLGYDPKFDCVQQQITKLLQDNLHRKLVIFSTYADTAEYVQNKLAESGFRALLYTGASQKNIRQVIRQNFDASYPKQSQRDDYDIVVATDVLSEGFNLNRAGVIINYDIPYNPTRVVQRIGRINRINKKMFDELYIFNLFPTDIGEKVTLIAGISKLKMLLINNIVGSDTRTLTPDENLESYFKKQFVTTDSDASQQSWDNEYINIYNSIKHDTTLFEQIMSLPERTRIVRKNAKTPISIAFAKRGNNCLFAMCDDSTEQAEMVSAQSVLHHFAADKQEQAYEFDTVVDQKFEQLRDQIFSPSTKIKIDKRKTDAIKKLEELLQKYSIEKDYTNALLEVIKTYDDLSDGELKIIASLKNDNIEESIVELKQAIPEKYIVNIMQKAQSIEAQTEIILFAEDIRK